MGSESYPFNYFSHEKLTREQVGAYLDRLHLPRDLLDAQVSAAPLQHLMKLLNDTPLLPSGVL